ncbi:Arginyl-tRNA--protein transferase 1 [Collariella sp. IMI 366227]|nr:Arginyl-tRNA--protein transferase 1 [Collariella sp. IMI 366227]
MQAPGDVAARYSYVFPIGYSYYAIAKSLTPAFYQKLVDRCWRRSGTLLYRPNQKHSCCPHYTLRLDSTEFKATKDQRQAVNRFNRHILGDTYAGDAARRHPRPRAEVRRRHNVFDVVERVHESEHEFLKEAPPSPDHVFTVTLEPDTFTDEKYAIFENYQRLVHREPPDKITRHGFERFLCNSPLVRETLAAPDGSTRPLGSFHQCYRIDGKLVAVGVLDLLPDCVSAVYFLYHESIHHLNPGKLGALREIALAREAGYRWWYPGYYVHNCAKMRYKIEYKPQYVLDPEDLNWYSLDKQALELATHHQTPLPPLTPHPSHPPSALPPENHSEGSDSQEDADSEEFLLTSNMPGIPSLTHMQSPPIQQALDCMVLRSDFSDNLIVASHLVIWEAEQVCQYGTLKSRIAELAAAVGVDLVGEVWAVGFE